MYPYITDYKFVRCIYLSHAYFYIKTALTPGVYVRFCTSLSLGFKNPLLIFQSRKITANVIFVFLTDII